MTIARSLVPVSPPDDNVSSNPSLSKSPVPEDCLVSLPGDVIFNILSRLSAKEAAKMRSLSSQWCRRLCSILPLEFHDSGLISQSQIRYSSLSKHQDRCIPIVDRILASSSFIHSVTLSRFFLPHVDPTTHVRWFEILAQRGIQCLSLRSDGYPLYLITSFCLLNCPTLLELDLRFCQIIASVALPRLRMLYLKHTRLSDECLHGLLFAGCPVLERLKMRYCKGIKTIMICSNSLRKFDLKISSYYSDVPEIVIENAPNLEQLKLCEHARKMVSVNVVHAPKLQLDTVFHM